MYRILCGIGSKWRYFIQRIDLVSFYGGGGGGQVEANSTVLNELKGTNRGNRKGQKG